MLVSDFNFDLPEELIAQHPPAERGSSRMLLLDRATGALSDEHFASLPNLLRPGDLLILNDSRVLPARLYATRAGARTQHSSPQPCGLIEVLLTGQIEDSAHPGEDLWRALVKPARKIHPGEILRFHGNEENHSVILSGANGVPGQLAGWGRKNPRISLAPAPESNLPAQPLLTAEVLSAGAFGERTLRFAPVEDFYATLARIGHMPLPPYIRRDQSSQADSEEDRERYQTVYSHEPGSAAAPTAGLHFTPRILAALTARGVEVATLTLHVGLGTFQPVRVSRLADIRLHAERYTLPAATAEALNRALREGRRIVAAGTTTTRTLEHIAAQATRLGAPSMTVSSGAPCERSLLAGVESSWVGSNEPQRPPLHFEPHSGSTSIFLSPGHQFRIVNGLLTNFHLPESTLLMLVAAFAARTDTGERTTDNGPGRGRHTILAAYAHAIRHRYRFYSYGDCMLLL